MKAEAGSRAGKATGFQRGDLRKEEAIRAEKVSQLFQTIADFQTTYLQSKTLRNTAQINTRRGTRDMYKLSSSQSG